MSGSPTVEQVQRWVVEVDTVSQRIGRHFARSEPRHAIDYLQALLTDTERMNDWQNDYGWGTILLVDFQQGELHE
ncbi:hypothetical protein [Tuwongella immobilis]|uniref:Uncharacterized protein n=1 Tax=Tuwongella immobilis TaxID=692036 RepID=A0A6C2YU90_9BACT|nr:hypothetical protein [Tuwongella immobilis]VIP05190.1 unnamed protein product [Tuwongella immobilis]VTS07736.1 unnamed protein product [Tuwongella immobilis]